MTDAPTMAGQPLLRVSDLSLRFGGVVALAGVAFDVEARSIVGLIGPNGAGKTTLFNCISRLYRPDRGDIRFGGRSLLGLPPHRIAPLGIARTFQNLALFPTLPVLENVMIGAHCRSRSDFLSDALRLPWIGREERRLRALRAEALLVELGLEDVAAHARRRADLRHAKAGRARARARARADPAAARRAGGRPRSRPRSRISASQIRALRDQRRLTVLLVEHHLQLVMAVSDKVVAFDFGRKIADGAPAEVQAPSRRDPRLSRRRGLMAGLLEVAGLEAFYGQTQALFGIDLALEAGGITTILGANGAGKTTTLRAISALVRTRGQNHVRRPADRAAEPGGDHAARDRARARRPRHVPAPLGRRQPAAWRLHRAAIATGVAGRPRAGRELLPGARRAPAAAGRHACRAASSRCWRSRAR